MLNSYFFLDLSLSKGQMSELPLKSLQLCLGQPFLNVLGLSFPRLVQEDPVSYLSGAFLGQPTQWLGTTHIGCFSHHPVGWQKCGFVGLLHSRACSLCGASQTIPAPGELPSRAGQGRHIRHLWGEAVPWGWGKSRWNFWRRQTWRLPLKAGQE